jgi:hypothetical protein
MLSVALLSVIMLNDVAPGIIRHHGLEKNIGALIPNGDFPVPSLIW